jgi:hypothetical protein
MLAPNQQFEDKRILSVKFKQFVRWRGLNCAPPHIFNKQFMILKAFQRSIFEEENANARYTAFG